MTTIVREYSTLKLSIFHENSKEDSEQHSFVCDTIWLVKQTTDNCVKIVLLETTFRDFVLAWYMKFKATTPLGRGRMLTDIQQTLFKVFQNPKFESQCSIEIKETKQQQGQFVWDFDQWFKVLMDQLTFQIPDAQHREWFIAGLLPHRRIPLTQQKVTS